MAFRDPIGNMVDTRGNFECRLSMQSMWSDKIRPSLAYVAITGNIYTEKHKEVCGRVKTLMFWMGATDVFHPGASGGGKLCLHTAVWCESFVDRRN